MKCYQCKREPAALMVTLLPPSGELGGTYYLCLFCLVEVAARALRATFATILAAAQSAAKE
jgi:hypothetical protein